MTQADKPRALIADDDPGQRLLLEEVLGRAGFSVVAVGDGATAVARATAGNFDIIFLDVVMPVKTGLEACREIRATLGVACPPIIVATSRDSDDAIAEGFTAGATDYLIKPVNWTLLQHRIGGWLRPADVDSGAKSSERHLLVARNGQVLTDNQASKTGSTATVGLADVVAPAFADQLLVCVRKVLKTRAPTSCRFADWEATIEIQGREKASVAIRKVDVDADRSAELYRLAYLDPLTDLPNRHLFERTAKAALIDAQLRGLGLTLMCVTLEAAGAGRGKRPPSGALVRTIAQEMVVTLRSTDCVARLEGHDAGDQTVASIDGLHFLVLLTDTAAPNAMDAVVQRIREACALASKRELANDDSGGMALTPRIGVARFPEDADDLSQLIELSILAAGHALDAGESRPRRARAQLLPAHLRDDLAAELRRALDRGEICLHYQPRVDLASRRVTGAEALLRWQHPLRGPIAAAQLIDVAEAAGAIRPLMDLAIEQACQQARDWAGRLPAGFPVSINVSANQLARADFAPSIVALLARLELDPARIEIEVPESCIDASDATLGQLLMLRDAGIGLIVDDFGTGRASLASLRRLRIDGFKIDHSQIQSGGWSQDESGVYTMAASIARVRHACVIAKRIESAAELAVARAGGCDQVQGYYVCQPLPAAEFEQYVATAGSTLGMTTSPGVAI